MSPLFAQSLVFVLLLGISGKNFFFFLFGVRPQKVRRFSWLRRVVVASLVTRQIVRTKLVFVLLTDWPKLPFLSRDIGGWEIRVVVNYGSLTLAKTISYRSLTLAQTISYGSLRLT